MTRYVNPLDETPSQRFRVYDNGGETLDRYTVVFPNIPESHGTVAALAMNSAPFHGFGQRVSAIPGHHLGKLIRFADLPTEDCNAFVRQELAALADAYSEPLRAV